MTATIWYCLSSPFFLELFQLGYSRLGQSPKVNFLESFYSTTATGHMPFLLPNPSTEGWLWKMPERYITELSTMNS